jgi:hypothetical protein
MAAWAPAALGFKAENDIRTGWRASQTWWNTSINTCCPRTAGAHILSILQPSSLTPAHPHFDHRSISLVVLGPIGPPARWFSSPSVLQLPWRCRPCGALIPLVLCGSLALRDASCFWSVDRPPSLILPVQIAPAFGILIRQPALAALASFPAP